MERHLTRILLIEDDEEDYFLLRKILTKIADTRYEVTWMSSYVSGLSQMLAYEHDICLVDYRLGAQNGIELMKDARQHGYDRPIILLTGANEGEIDIQAIQAGADDYIAKEQLQGALIHRIIRYAIERKKAEHERERLLRQQIAIQELEKKRNEFISMVVHELKTPLTSLKGYAQLIRKHSVTNGEERTIRLADRMDIQITKLNGLINEFQDVIRIEGGRLQFHESEFLFDKLVSELVEDLQLTTQQQIILTGQTEAQLRGDPGRIEQVITNLITNAMKYAPETDRILVNVSVNEQAVTLCVRDFGPGIPEEMRTRIFEPFYRIDGDQQNAPGLGLGLYISAEIIRRHKGHIWVESPGDRGAMFCFTLPRQGALQMLEVQDLVQDLTN
jgi:signal transduction histidine kinase